MSKKWNREQKTDSYYQKAKKENYRSRASFKLLQLNKKFKIIHKGDRIVDFGAAPGGWSQVALEIVGDEGLVVGVDLQRIRPFEEENFTSIRGDFTSPETITKLGEALGREADVILSDASPKLTGVRDVDQMRALHLATTILDLGDILLKNRGLMVMKVFQGESFPELLKEFKKKFRVVKTTKPPSSRKKSVEMYVFGRDFLKKR